MTASSDFVAAIQQKLNAQVDIVWRSFSFLLGIADSSRNLDAITQAGEGTVRPARATVLGDVLIETFG